MSLFVLVGSLTSSPDPNITLEALNFLLSSEVYIIVEVKIFSYVLIFNGLMELGMLMLALFPIQSRFVPKMLFLDLLLVEKEGKQLGHG